MKSKQILEGSSIVLAVFTVFIVMSTALSAYSTYLLAILIIFSAIYISIKKRSKSASNLFSGGSVELYGLIAIITLMISLTNGLNSPLFFFTYFILFLLAFLCEPITILVYLISALLFFMPQATANPNTDMLIKMGSLILIAPIAYFIGQEFERRKILDEKIESKTDEIIQEARLLKEDGNPKGQDESEAIDEIIEEASSLKKDSEE